MMQRHMHGLMPSADDHRRELRGAHHTESGRDTTQRALSLVSIQCQNPPKTVYSDTIRPVTRLFSMSISPQACLRCKRSRVQISAARPNSSKKLHTRLAACPRQSEPEPEARPEGGLPPSMLIGQP